MKLTCLRHLLPTFCLLAILFLGGCAAQKKSVIVLLPEGDRVSGEVTVTNAAGSQVLNRSWQSVEVAGAGSQPTKPAVLEGAALQGVFGKLQAAMPVPPVHYLLHFKLGSVELLPDSQQLIPEIARVITSRSPAQLSVVGHADTIGSVEYNYQLGMKRAAAVAELLAKQGAVPASVETSSRGKTDLLVKTPDQTPDQRNRRAEVTVR
jgi:outer membrane protein OmpA-like peptidoglycan-associated protein